MNILGIVCFAFWGVFLHSNSYVVAGRRIVHATGQTSNEAGFLVTRYD